MIYLNFDFIIFIYNKYEFLKFIRTNQYQRTQKEHQNDDALGCKKRHHRICKLSISKTGEKLCARWQVFEFSDSIRNLKTFEKNG